MAAIPNSLTERLRQPAYTGENRCTPCTVLNTALAVGFAGAVSLLLTPLAGGAVLAGSLAAIYFRGYLVPGTPELTKRHLPDRVRRWFGKAPESPAPGEPLDVEAYLHEVGAVATDEQAELVLTSEFAAAWQRAIDDAREHTAAGASALLGIEDVAVETRDGACVVTEDGIPAADWPSEAALIADLGAVELLEERDPTWHSREHEERGRILAGLRVFAEDCPACGGTPELGEETVESCCRRAEVVTYSCPDCGSRLLELEQ
jgi:hypothetical protein